MDQSYTYVPYQVVEQRPGELRAIVSRYARRWPWVLGSLLLSLGAAWIWLDYQPPIYRVQASLLIKDGKKGLEANQALKEMELFTPKKMVENEIEILKSYALMQPIVARLDLSTRYYTTSLFGKRETYRPSVRLLVEQPTDALYREPLTLTFPKPGRVQINKQDYPLNQSLQTPWGRLRVFTDKSNQANQSLTVRVQHQTETVQQFVNALKAEPTSKLSSVILLTLDDALPERSEAVLKQLIDEYNRAAIADKNTIASNTLTFIEDRLRLIAGELASVEKDVERYKSSQGITDLSAQAQTFLTTLQQNDTQLNQVTMQLGALADVERYLSQQGAGQSVAPATLGLGDPVLLGLVNRLADLTLRREQLIRNTSEQNPLIQTIDGQISETRTNIDANVQMLKKQLLTAKGQLAATNGRVEGQIQSIPGKERQLFNISRQQAVKNSLYTYLLQKREETAVSFAATISDSRTVNAPRPLPTPVRPVRPLAFLLFGLAGLLFPIGIMIGRDALNNRVLRRADVEGQTTIPILGELKRGQRSGNTGSFALGNPHQPVLSEQIRTLRVNLSFTCPNAIQERVVLITSSISGEGKSFVALNLGASLAEAGYRTVLVSMDLRKPTRTNEPGLSTYLNGQADLATVLQSVDGQSNLFVISSGPTVANPSVLLGKPTLPTLIETLKTRFDYILIDSPPASLFADAQRIAPLADATIYVLRHDLTPRPALRQLEGWHREGRFPQLGVVLNGVSDGEAYYNHRQYGAYYRGG